MQKTILIILIIIWMVIVFLFSNQPGDISSSTSGGFIEKIIKIFIKGKEETEKQEIIKKLQLPIRKLAHFTIYLIGGILVALFIKTYNIPTTKQIIISQIFLSIYAATDEIHQYFIPRKNSYNNRCFNRFARCISRYNNYNDVLRDNFRIIL